MLILLIFFLLNHHHLHDQFVKLSYLIVHNDYIYFPVEKILSSSYLYTFLYSGLNISPYI